MIKIRRAKAPEHLHKSKSKNRWNAKEVVAALWKMQHGKCCYCERNIPDFGQAKAVEHFHPKSKFSDKKNAWENLLLVCSQCNGIKLDKFPCQFTKNKNEAKVISLHMNNGGERLSPLLIDPSDPAIDPEEHIAYFVDDRELAFLGIPMARNNSLRGKTTVETIGLDQKYHIGEIQKFILDTLIPACTSLVRATHYKDVGLAKMYRELFQSLASEKNEYAAVVREFIRFRKLEDLGVTIP